MASKKISALDLDAFSTGQSKSSTKAINVYFRKRYHQRYSVNADNLFSDYLAKLVNKEDGFVGRHSGWIQGGALQMSALHSRLEEIGSQDDRDELDESQGGEDDDAGQSSHPHARAGRPKTLKRANEQLAGPKGKGRAGQTIVLAKPPKSQGGESDHAEESPPPPARATRSTSTAPEKADERFANPKGKGRVDRRGDLSNPPKNRGGEDGLAEESAPPLARVPGSMAPKKANKQLADPERVSTPKPDAKADTPIRTSRMSPGISSNKEFSSPSRTGSKPSGVDEEETDTEIEEDDGDTQSSGEGGGETVDEEHESGEETSANVPPAAEHWRGFQEAFDDVKNRKYASIEDWYSDALRVIEEHRERLYSMSTD
jgi:hypothetical protein